MDGNEFSTAAGRTEAYAVKIPLAFAFPSNAARHPARRMKATITILGWTETSEKNLERLKLGGKEGVVR